MKKRKGVFSEVMDGKRVIYGDWAATTPVSAEVLNAMMPWLSSDNGFGNPSSLHTLGDRARDAVEKAREQVAFLLGAQPMEVFFTSCATESSNWAIKGAAFRALAEGSRRRRFLVSAVEHPSVIAACESLAPLGFHTERIPVNENGAVSPEAFSGMMDKFGEECLLAAVMHANNETGVIQPVSQCAEIARRHGVLFLTDAVQTVGHIPVDVKALECDFLSVSGHKLGTPKGIGALYIRSGAAVSSLIHGGGQETGKRSGTENVPYIIGLGEACRIASDRLKDGSSACVAAYRDELECRLLSLGGIVNGDKDARVPGILNISFDGISGEGLMFLCDFHGVCISTGSACSMGHGDDVSHVLRAMNLSESAAKGTIRISIGEETTREDVLKIAETVEESVRHLRTVQ